MARITHIALACAYSVAALLVCAMLIRFEIADVSQAWTISAILGLVVAQVHIMIAREMGRDSVSSRIKELAAAKRLMVEEIIALRERIGDLEEDVIEDGESRHAAIVAEMRTLEDLVHTVGERFDTRVAAARRQAGVRPGAVGDPAASLARVRDALAEGRVDLHLQPIVTLPQRKTAFFESYSRLRDARGDVIMPSEWLRVAEPAGLIAEVDNLLLFRCVQIVRKLAERDRRIGIFCNVSAASLADQEFFPQFLDFVRRNSDLSESLIFEIGQRAYEGRDLNAARAMAALAEYGFRFSLDKVDTLDFDVADASRAGMHFLKAPADLLIETLRPGENLGLSIAPEILAEDYPSLLAKYGVELIAEKIEDEATAIEVIELDIRLAQGHLFGAPKPIHDSALEDSSAPRARKPARRAAG